jgi:Tfp pilus assembly protein PilO
MNNGTSKARSLIMLTALVAVVILIAAWFLLLSPVLSGAAEANANADAQEQSNADTQVQVNKLKQQYAQLPEYQAQLDALQTQIPTTPAYPDLQRMFAAIAAEHNVVITSLQFGSAVPLGAAPPAPPTDEGDGSEPAPSATPEPTTGTDGAATGDVPAAFAGLFGIPTSMTVVGKYEDVMSVLKELQSGTDRIVLVSTVALSRGADATTTASIPGADATGVFSGSTFVLTSSTPTEVPTDGTSASPTPSPSASATS